MLRRSHWPLRAGAARRWAARWKHRPRPAAPSKTLGRKEKGTQGTLAANVVSRALVRQKLADRLAGRLTPAELAAWARSKWAEVQRGAPAEGGYRDMLEDFLLTLSSLPANKLSDSELVNMMTRLEG